MSAKTLLEQHLGRSLTAFDVADFLQCDVATIYRHYSKLGGVKVGSCYRFFEARLIDALAVSPESKERQTGCASVEPPSLSKKETEVALPISSPVSPKVGKRKAKGRSAAEHDSNPHGLL